GPDLKRRRALFSQTRSPRTLLEAQLRVERGLGNRRGFSQVQRTAAAMGTRDHRPHQARLQKASTSRGRAVFRVHTLHGLAWRSQASSDRAKARATPFSHARAASLLSGAPAAERRTGVIVGREGFEPPTRG